MFLAIFLENFSVLDLHLYIIHKLVRGLYMDLVLDWIRLWKDPDPICSDFEKVWSGCGQKRIGVVPLGLSLAIAHISCKIHPPPHLIYIFYYRYPSMRLLTANFFHKWSLDPEDEDFEPLQLFLIKYHRKSEFLFETICYVSEDQMGSFEGKKRSKKSHAWVPVMYVDKGIISALWKIGGWGGGLSGFFLH
jgi:hypothetical protein